MLAKKLFLSFLSILSLTTIASSIALADTTNVNPNDPYEDFNRHAYMLNSKLDKVIFKPVATVYKTVLPKPVTESVANFFSNLNEIPTAVNDTLQGNFYMATSDFWRFTVNSTAGVLGLFDVASKIGLQKHNQDLGLTFAAWGYRSSNYLVLPIFGPSTVRDAVALPINQSFFTAYSHINSVSLRNSLYGTNVVNQRAQLLRYDKVIQQVAFDRYTFERDAYLQRRRSQMAANKVNKAPEVEPKNIIGD